VLRAATHLRARHGAAREWVSHGADARGPHRHDKGFAAPTPHEVNQPITAMVTNAQAALRLPPSDEGRRGAARTSDENRMFTGANAMRSFFALGLLITLCASASAATVHHSWHHVIVRPSQGRAYAAPRPPTDHDDDTPSYDDPSKFGGSAALPVTR
jgi:hypothetical protein